MFIILRDLCFGRVISLYFKSNKSSKIFAEQQLRNNLGGGDKFAYFTHELSRICQNNNGIQNEKWRYVINSNNKYASGKQWQGEQKNKQARNALFSDARLDVQPDRQSKNLKPKLP